MTAAITARRSLQAGRELEGAIGYHGEMARALGVAASVFHSFTIGCDS